MNHENGKYSIGPQRNWAEIAHPESEVGRMFKRRERVWRSLNFSGSPEDRLEELRRAMAANPKAFFLKTPV